jgi:hypothetical protein
MKILRSLILLTVIGLGLLGFVPQLSAGMGALNTGRGGLNAGNEAPLGLRSTYNPRTSSDGRSIELDANLKSAQRPPEPMVEPEILLSAEPVSTPKANDEWKARREPVRSYNTNAIDSDGNIYFSPNLNSSRAQR